MSDFLNSIREIQCGPYFVFAEEIEKREKALVEELEIIEGQVGLGKHQQNFDNPPFSVIEEEPQSMKEGEEENQDPNPDKNNGEIDKDVHISPTEKNGDQDQIMADDGSRKDEEMETNHIEEEGTNG